jgi:glycine/D-amino acid oxidase-like deaminating enzyme
MRGFGFCAQRAPQNSEREQSRPASGVLYRIDLLMDLKSGQPFWPIKNRSLGAYFPLNQDVDCEVAVVGAGITGALVAYYLTKEGVPTVIVDRREVGTGSTGATTGLLQYEVDTPLFELMGKVGEKKAVRSYQLCLEAIYGIEQLVHELGDSCDFERKQSLYLASRSRDVEILQKEYNVRTRNGIRLELLGKEAVRESFQLDYPAALLSFDAGQIDAYRLTHLLLRAACNSGLQVYDQTEITDHRSDKHGAELITKRRNRIKARRMVFANGYEIPVGLRKDIVQLKSTYALVSTPCERLPEKLMNTLTWETARPYFYLRTTKDGRVLIGGEDDNFDSPRRRDARVGKKSKKLVKRFKEMFPEVKLSVAYNWAGTFGETKDGLAYIGETRKRPNCYFALGYGGNGITYSLIAAHIIRDLYTGRPNPNAAIFAFDR